MKRTLATALAILGALLSYPPVRAQQERVFTTGTARELAIAHSTGLRHMQSVARQHGIDRGQDLVVSRVTVDELSMAHTRIQQHLRGVPVFGGEAIVHLKSNGEVFSETNHLISNLNVDTVPRVTVDTAIALAVAEYGCPECLTAPPRADLWVLRHEGGDRLVYRVQLRREDGTQETALPVIFVDAHLGTIVSRYDNLQTGTGPSLYSGTVTIGTSLGSTGRFYMENLSRRVGTFDMFNGTTDTFRLSDTNDVWDLSFQRAGVDVQYGTERFLQYLLSTHGYNGLDGFGGPFFFAAQNGVTPLLSSRVHYGVAVNNAFWNGFVMTYGDGDGFTASPFVSLDIVAHEMTHGITEFTANLIYQGESGALNESWSDVFGAMAERYVRGESANTWLNGEEVLTPGIGGDAFRYMDNPHRASNRGYTADDDPDHYSERYTGSQDNGGVHVNSGIANKAFFLLAKGGSHHLGGTMTGIGADAAARIWFTALRSYMTSTTNFAGARVATMNAAAALHGSGSTQHAAVSAAWCLVGVGTCTVPTADLVTPSSGTGMTQTFAFQYSDSAGATNISTAWFWFNSSLASSAANSCMAYYDRAANTMHLINDAGTAFLSANLSSPGTLQNASCAILLGSSFAATSGTTLTLNLAITFKTAFTGSKSIFMYTANATGANSGWQNRGSWTVMAPATVGATAVTPASGSGTSQTFALTYSDSLGASDLSTVWVWFNATFASSAANSCMAYLDRGSNTLFLADDAGTGWTHGVLGTSATLQNASCSIALASSSRTLSGNNLTLNLAVSFKPAFSGTKNIYMFAGSMGGSFSGWQNRGTWTVPAAPAAVVTANTVSPNTGSGASQTFTLEYADSLGATDLSSVWVWFNATLAATSANSCLLNFDRAAGTLNLLNDAGTAWLSAAAAGGGTLQNSQCSLAVSESSATVNGNVLTLRLAMSFKPSYAGSKSVFMYALGAGGQNSGWQTRGTWTVPGGGPTPAVTADTVTPDSGSGSTQSFVLKYSDTTGATNLSTVWAWFNATFASSAANSCLMYYDRSATRLFVLNDGGTDWLSGTPGTTGTIGNSQCSVDLDGSSATIGATQLTLTVALTLKPAFAGAKNIYMYATNPTLNSGWQTRGTWTVPGAGPEPSVTADSVTPGSGSGATEAFSLRYSDSTGATNLKTAWVWFNASFASTADNTCLLYYDRPAQTLFLLNDAGTDWFSGTPGTAATLQNSQCSVDLASTTTSLASTTLTVNLPVSFAPAYSGTKNIYMYAANAARNSGWQSRGRWTVPE